MTDQELFIQKFNNVDNGFYDLTSYIDGFGFSIRKKLNEQDSENVSVLSFYIPEKILKNEQPKKCLYIDAYYGKISGSGITLRDFSKSKLMDPIDLISNDEYFYNIENGKLFKKNKEISPSGLLNDIYQDHIKSTNLIKGFLIRIRIFFWNIILKSIFNYIAIFLHYLLRFINGDKYSFEPIFKEEVLNNIVINSSSRERIGREVRGSYFKFQPMANEENLKERYKQNKTIDFLGYATSYWSIIVYSIIHMLFYGVFYYYNLRPKFITEIFKNAFLTLIYVIISLWIFENVMPAIFKRAIKFSSTVSFYLSTKKIKI